MHKKFRTEETLAALEAAKQRGYALFRTSQRPSRLRPYSEWCNQMHQPQIYVEITRSGARTEMDLYFVKFDRDSVRETFQEAIRKLYLDTIDSNTWARQKTPVGTVYNNVKCKTVEQAERIAQGYVHIYNSIILPARIFPIEIPVEGDLPGKRYLKYPLTVKATYNCWKTWSLFYLSNFCGYDGEGDTLEQASLNFKDRLIISLEEFEGKIADPRYANYELLPLLKKEASYLTSFIGERPEEETPGESTPNNKEDRREDSP